MKNINANPSPDDFVLVAAVVVSKRCHRFFVVVFFFLFSFTFLFLGAAVCFEARNFLAR